jgi:hypothetical protein
VTSSGGGGGSSPQHLVRLILTIAVGPGYLKVSYDRKQVKDAPSIGTDGELPAGDEEAIFKHYGLTYQPGANGERLLARR